VRTDHSAMLRLALSDIDAQTEAALRAIGYEPSDWTSRLRRPAPQATWFLSFWTDSFCRLYRHRTLGFCAPFLLPADPHAGTDVTALDPEYVGRFLQTDRQRAQYQHLKDNFDCVGPSDEQHIRSTLRLLLERTARDTRIFVVLAPEAWLSPQGQLMQRPEEQRINQWIRAELDGVRNVRLVDIGDFVEPGTGRAEPLHFDRLTYKRAADWVLELLREAATQPPGRAGGPPAGRPRLRDVLSRLPAWGLSRRPPANASRA
jgi:hypothetical protein